MKKKLLVTAMLAGLGVASTSQAVFVNPDNTGQVLLFPYYTVQPAGQGNFRTSIHIVNTKNETKAVKVRILEGRNSQEVLDFNLYLSPYDVWAGAIVFDEVDGARIRSRDRSCIAPRQLDEDGEPFRNLRFAGEPDGNDPNRWREGYVEVIEMGVITDPALQAAIKHSSGETPTPANCDRVVQEDRDDLIRDKVAAPTGGLFGSGHLIAVQDGIRTSYDATALDAWRNTPFWTNSASLQPRLEQVSPATGDIIVGNLAVQFVARPGRAIDAVSAVLTEAAIANEYTIDRRPNDADRDSKTDWVITFPTKRFYVESGDPSPFEELWRLRDGKFESCHTVDFEFFDREERGIVPGEGDFSPAPLRPGFALCNEVNTLTLYPRGTDPDEGRLFGAVSTAASLAIDERFIAGWMNMGFDTDPASATGFLVGAIGTSPNNETLVVQGLPVIGFSAMSNSVPVDIAGLPDGALSNYLGHTDHKGERLVFEGSGTDLEDIIRNALFRGPITS